MARFTDEQIEKASKVSILQVAESLGIKVHKVGNSKYSYRSVENSGLVFSELKNTFHMHSSLFGQAAGTGGSVIDFVKIMTNLNFPQTVNKLLTENYDQVEIKNESSFKKEPFNDYFNRSADNKQTAVKNYLINERKLDERIISHLMSKNYIKEDYYKQAIFYHAKHGVKVGATVQGTVYDPEKFGKRGRFKGIAKNSESGFGFNVQLGEKVEKLYVFESPIDALSYWSLHPTLKNSMLASIDGSSTKSNTVFNIMNYLAMEHNFDDEEDINKFQVLLSMDNDAPDKFGKRSGQDFIQKFLDYPIVRQQAPEYKENRLFIDNSPNKMFKDWNDQLKFVRQLEISPQFINPERHQFVQISREKEKYKVEFIGNDVPEEYVSQPVIFDATSKEEVIKLLKTYDFQRISKHDLQRFGYDALNRKETPKEISTPETSQEMEFA